MEIENWRLKISIFADNYKEGATICRTFFFFESLNYNVNSTAPRMSSSLAPMYALNLPGSDFHW